MHVTWQAWENKDVAWRTISENTTCRHSHGNSAVYVSAQCPRLERDRCCSFWVTVGSSQLWLQGHHRREQGRKPCSQSDSINIYEGGKEPVDCTLTLCQTFYGTHFTIISVSGFKFEHSLPWTTNMPVLLKWLWTSNLKVFFFLAYDCFILHQRQLNCQDIDL